jgi:hypothetical protein
MLLASMAGSIGIAVPSDPVAELANPVNRPGTPDPGMPIRPNSPTKWAQRGPGGTDPSIVPGPRRPVTAGLAARLVGYATRWLLRPPTAAVGLVPARGDGQAQTPSASVGRPGQPQLVDDWAPAGVEPRPLLGTWSSMDKAVQPADMS